MIIKVCGMREPENINALQELDIDFMGIIRYPKSKRYVTDQQASVIESLTMNKGTVGVYVNATMPEILKDIIPLELDVIQLHGDEDSAFAKALLELGIKVFKAFQISENFNFDTLNEWQELGKVFKGKLFFLFDTATPDYGGSGKHFDWSQLDNYKGEIPFLLSGGLSNSDAKAIKSFKHDKLLGIDLNSRFESKPGLKDINALREFIKKLRS